MPKIDRKNKGMHDIEALFKAFRCMRSPDSRQSKYDYGDGMAVLARKLKVAPQLVSLWKNMGAAIPAERCIEIELLTKGRVKREEIRPDIFVRGKECVLGYER